jgi:hypothetical protein
MTLLISTSMMIFSKIFSAGCRRYIHSRYDNPYANLGDLLMMCGALLRVSTKIMQSIIFIYVASATGME